MVLIKNRTILLILPFDMCIIIIGRKNWRRFCVYYSNRIKDEFGKISSYGRKRRYLYTRNGKIVAKLSNPYQDRVDVAKSLFGIIPDEMTLEEAREERLGKI